MKATEIALGVVCIGLLALSFVLGSELNNTNKKLRDLASRPAQVVKEVEYLHTETVVESECPECPVCVEHLTIKAEESYIWVYRDGVPVAFFPRAFLLDQ